MIIITSEIFKNIDDNNYIKKYSKTSMIIITSKKYSKTLMIIKQIMRNIF